MSHSGIYKINIDIKEEKETFAVFQDLGITPNQAIKMFFAQVRKTHSIPFLSEFTPNKTTISAIEDAKIKKNIVLCKDTNDLFDKLGI